MKKHKLDKEEVKRKIDKFDDKAIDPEMGAVIDDYVSVHNTRRVGRKIIENDSYISKTLNLKVWSKLGQRLTIWAETLKSTCMGRQRSWGKLNLTLSKSQGSSLWVTDCSIL